MRISYRRLSARERVWEKYAYANIAYCFESSVLDVIWADVRRLLYAYNTKEK